MISTATTLLRLEQTVLLFLRRWISILTGCLQRDGWSWREVSKTGERNGALRSLAATVSEVRAKTVSARFFVDETPNPRQTVLKGQVFVLLTEIKEIKSVFDGITMQIVYFSHYIFRALTEA